MKILVMNAGSNSLKWEIVEAPEQAERSGEVTFGRKLWKGSYDNIGKPEGQLTVYESKNAAEPKPMEIRDYGHAAEMLLNLIGAGDGREKGVASLRQIDAVGHRVVHGADCFAEPARVTADVIRQIEALEELAPLHNASALAAIRAAQSVLGAKFPMVAVFDTVFHREIPEVAALYPFPLTWARDRRIRRYGFHGVSHRYLTTRYAQIVSKPLKDVTLVTLHLEGGSSAAAIRAGKSIDTSMGFTPLEGLMMGTRSGDIDPAIVTYLLRKDHSDADRIESFLNKECGLLGVSGKSEDTRDLMKHLDVPDVVLAMKMFAYRVRKYVGAYLAALGGAEAIVFGGGIGENTPLIREWIAEPLGWFGLTLDQQRNAAVIDCEGEITSLDSRLKAWVIPTEEALMVAHETAACLARR